MLHFVTWNNCLNQGTTSIKPNTNTASTLTVFPHTGTQTLQLIHRGQLNIIAGWWIKFISWLRHMSSKKIKKQRQTHTHTHTTLSHSENREEKHNKSSCLDTTAGKDRDLPWLSLRGRAIFVSSVWRQRKKETWASDIIINISLCSLFLKLWQYKQPPAPFPKVPNEIRLLSLMNHLPFKMKFTILTVRCD